ncbi:2Fe-2S iron-sulfur cluster-binding protein [Streptomyces sp. NPDC058385]|uniref:2Fe-2S iron-sulfur cluster-binding protein n=1 Tax=Streptomyces sp. NPDC058385 TaxID=3346473 RepID=UPI003659811D
MLQPRRGGVSVAVECRAECCSSCTMVGDEAPLYDSAPDEMQRERGSLSRRLHGLPAHAHRTPP